MDHDKKALWWRRKNLLSRTFGAWRLGRELIGISQSYAIDAIKLRHATRLMKLRTRNSRENRDKITFSKVYWESRKQTYFLKLLLFRLRIFTRIQNLAIYSAFHSVRRVFYKFLNLSKHQKQYGIAISVANASYRTTMLNLFIRKWRVRIVTQFKTFASSVIDTFILKKWQKKKNIAFGNLSMD